MVDEGNNLHEVEMQPNDDGAAQWTHDDRMKRLIFELQKHWLSTYQKEKQKAVTQLITRVSHFYYQCISTKCRLQLHADLTEAVAEKRASMTQQFKVELENKRYVFCLSKSSILVNCRDTMTRQHQETLEQQIKMIQAEHENELAASKRKQWCHTCEAEGASI